jgi:uncharacterized protein YjiK
MKLSSLAAFVASALAPMSAMAVNSVDLSTYQLVGRYALPSPPAGTTPANLLAQEASGVTWNRDTNTLFVVGDGGRAVTQVSLTGSLIDTMTLASGSSPQGTAFYDPEGITYVGNNTFVMVEERSRVANQFTYTPNTTLSYSGAQQVKLGTTIGNVGLEGLSYDPKTGGFIFAKEISPMGVFQTTIDFSAGTASNGSATTANSVNLFNPSLIAGSVADLADVFALSNVTASGSTDYDNILLLSQESGKVIKVDRSGSILGTLNIPFLPSSGTPLTGAGGPLSLADQQHEGMTMDDLGNLYVVSENGGGNIDNPQLWVFAPVPEPETYALMLAGLALIGLRRRAKRSPEDLR